MALNPWLARRALGPAIGLAVMAAWSPAVAAEVTGYGLLTTDYVFRGVTYSDSHAAAQGGIDVSLDAGVYGGFWASTVDLRGGRTRRDVEVNYYLGYSHDLNADWTFGASVVAYTFPGAEGPIDYDYNEVSVVANYRDRAWLEYSYSSDLFHTSRSTHHVELYGEWPLPRSFLVGGGIGYYDVSELAGAGYGYWQVGITRPFRRFALDFRFYDTNREVPIISAPDRGGARVALSVRLPFTIIGR